MARRGGLGRWRSSCRTSIDQDRREYRSFVVTHDATTRAAAGAGVPMWQRMGLGVLAQHVPAALVDQVLSDTGRLQQRVRRLPSGAAGAFLAGLRLVSWDATMLDVPDSPANEAAFLASRNTRGRGAFPKVRLLQLIECGTHAVIDAVFGAASEQVLARRVLGSLGQGMLLLGDRNFPSYRLWQEATATGAHLLWRVKANTLLPRIGTFTDGSYLAVLPRPGTRGARGSWVRVVEYRVIVTPAFRVIRGFWRRDRGITAGRKAGSLRQARKRLEKRLPILSLAREV